MLSLILIQGLALVLQALAALVALSLVRVTGRRTAWLLIACSIALIVVRRALSFPRLLAADLAQAPTVEQWLESGVLLVISLLQVGGLALLRPLFLTLQRSETILRGARTELEASVAERTAALCRTNEALKVEVAERQRMEASLQEMLDREAEARSALSEAELRYRTLFDISPAGILLVDGQTGTPLEFNRAAYEELGYTAEEYAGLRLHDLEVDATEASVRTRLQDLLREGHTTYVALYRTKTGGTRVMHVIAQTLTLQARTLIRVIFRDITELEEARATLERQAAELARSNTELEQFAYVASHDLQEPLRKITAFGDRLQARCADKMDEIGCDYLARMVGAAARMRRLIDDLLAYSRVHTRGQPFVPVSLDAVARGVLNDLELRILETGACVTVDPLPTLEADEHQMQQLLTNLLGNALKFRRPETPPEVRVTACVREDAWLELCVRDNGIGFDERFRERIFQPFQRLHTRDAYEGSGIGLAICQRIAVRHGGAIAAHSTPGDGSTFCVTLPLTHDETAQEERHAAAHHDPVC